MCHLAATFQLKCQEQQYRQLLSHMKQLKRVSYKEKQLPVRPSKRHKKKNNKPVPTSQEQYKIYNNVLPSSKAINDFNQSMAIQTEKDAATALHNKKALFIMIRLRGQK